MKKNFNCFTLAIVALLIVGFASCSNDDEPAVDNPAETISVFLKISNVPSTRAEVPTQTAEPVVFNSGHLYFTDGANIIRYYSIGPDVGADFTVADLTGGKNITNLPSTVTHAHVVGNTAVDPATTISGVKAQVLLVESQGTISNVNLYGESTIATNAVTVKISPTVARIELTDMTATGRITGFEVEGIFIDNYFSQAVIGGSVDNANLVPISTTAADYMESTKYPATLNPSIYDWYDTPLVADSSQVAKPSVATNVWGYNVFANNSAVPRIVIRLKNIVATGGLSFTNPQFITIKGFNDGAILSAIQSGHVYTIAAGGLEFDETNLTPKPNDIPVSVNVTVTVASWVVVPVTPIL